MATGLREEVAERVEEGGRQLLTTALEAAIPCGLTHPGSTLALPEVIEMEMRKHSVGMARWAIVR